MSDNSTAGPPVITQADLVAMRTNLVGACMGSLSYGVELCVFMAAVYFLLTRTNMKEAANRIMMSFAVVLFIGATCIVGLGIETTQIILIDSQVNSNDPGGAVLSFDPTLLGNRLNQVLNGVYIFTNFVADGIILYRLFWIWGRRWSIVALPAIVWLASTACSIILEYESTAETNIVIAIAIPYFSLSVSVTLLSTLLIFIRLMAGRRTVSKLLGTDHGTPYVSIAAMVVESAAIYSVVAILLIAFLATNNAGQNVVLPMMGQAMCVAPTLIIARVAAGQSFTRGTFNRTGTGMRFATGVTGNSSNAEVTKQGDSAFVLQSFGDKSMATQTSTKADNMTLHDDSGKDSASFA